MNNPNQKPHPNNLLASLPDDDQQRLLEWLDAHTYHEVIQLAICYSTLQRYYSHHCREQLLARHQETCDLLGGLRHASPTELAALSQTSLQLLQQRATAELLDPKTELKEQTHLSGLLLSIASLQLRQQQLDSTRQDLQLRREYKELTAQRFTFQSVHLLRQQFPFPDQIDLTAESQDIHTITRLLQSVLSGGSAPSNPAPNFGSFAPFAPSRDNPETPSPLKTEN